MKKNTIQLSRYAFSEIQDFFINWMEFVILIYIYNCSHIESYQINAQSLQGPILFFRGRWRCEGLWMPSWSKHDASMTVLCALLYHVCFYARPGAEFMKHFEFRSRLQKRKKEKKILSACQSAEFSLTMWTKSMGVAVYKSQCSLSRMILSMRRISAVEKLHPLCTTRPLTEPITC